MIEEIFNSEFKVYYLGLVTSIVAAFMCIIFLLFRSVATLMMMVSAILVMTVAVIILGIAIYLDFNEGRFNPSYQYKSERYE